MLATLASNPPILVPLPFDGLPDNNTTPVESKEAMAGLYPTLLSAPKLMVY